MTLKRKLVYKVSMYSMFSILILTLGISSFSFPNAEAHEDDPNTSALHGLGGWTLECDPFRPTGGEVSWIYYYKFINPAGAPVRNFTFTISADESHDPPPAGPPIHDEVAVVPHPGVPAATIFTARDVAPVAPVKVDNYDWGTAAVPIVLPAGPSFVLLGFEDPNGHTPIRESLRVVQFNGTGAIIDVDTRSSFLGCFVPKVPRTQGVGGEFLPIDTTALLLAGVQTNLAWIVPVALSVIGIGLVFLRKMNYNTKN